MTEVDDWVKTEQEKHRLCACGCGKEIKILKAHHCSRGIPKYVFRHHLNLTEKNPMYGKKHSDATKRLLKQNHYDASGENNSMYGKTFTKEHRDKISSNQTKRKKIDEWIQQHEHKHFCMCGCGTEIIITRAHYFDGIPKRILKHMSGKHHPSWKGGISFEPYCQKFNNELKERVRDRDNRTCQNCGIKENGIKLTCHHIHYDKENCYPDLITVCRSCNSKANTNREYWETHYMNILETRGLLNWS